MSIVDGHWLSIKDGDPRASYLFKRHYSCRKRKDGRRNQPQYRNRHLIMGPGQKMVLLTADGNALFGWRKFQSKDNQEGVNCAIFRNESEILSSTLILEAEQLAWRRWPGQRLYTYVNPGAIRGTNPGYCFMMAGWRPAGRTKKRNYLIFEKLPDTYKEI